MSRANSWYLLFSISKSKESDISTNLSTHLSTHDRVLDRSVYEEFFLLPLI